MVNLENRLVRYFLPPIVMFGSLLLGDQLGACRLPNHSSKTGELLELTTLIVGAGFVISVVATCATDFFCWCRNSYWEAIIPVNQTIRNRIDSFFLTHTTPSTPNTRDGQFYPFLVYHHMYIGKEFKELYLWSLRQFNSSVVAVNSIVGLLFVLVVVLARAVVCPPCCLSGCPVRSSFVWIGLNLLVIVFLCYYVLFTRRCRRRLFLFLTEQEVT